MPILSPSYNRVNSDIYPAGIIGLIELIDINKIEKAWHIAKLNNITCLLSSFLKYFIVRSAVIHGSRP